MVKITIETVVRHWDYKTNVYLHANGECMDVWRIGTREDEQRMYTDLHHILDTADFFRLPKLPLGFVDYQ